MALVHMKSLLKHAYENKYAVGAFDVVNLDMLQGIIDAAEKCRAPVILGIAEPHLSHFNIDVFAPAVETAAQKASIPVAVHFDHGSSPDNIRKGIQHGCNSVMIDGSLLELRENIDVTKRVVEMAHAIGVPVEAEIGSVPENDGDPDYTSVAEAEGFARLTKVDFLAVSIGTVHGNFTGKLKLDVARLKQINKALGIPLVLHGSSGLTDDQFRKLIANGIAKVNYFTALTDRAASLLRGNAKDTKQGYLKLFEGVRHVVEEEADRLMRVWGSAGRAAEVLEQCPPWQPIDHVIEFTLPGIDDMEEGLIIKRGQEMLESIAGVRDVSTVKQMTSQSGVHHLNWVLRVTDAKVLDQIRDNQAFASFVSKNLAPENIRLTSKSFIRQS